MSREGNQKDPSEDQVKRNAKAGFLSPVARILIPPLSALAQGHANDAKPWSDAGSLNGRKHIIRYNMLCCRPSLVVPTQTVLLSFKKSFFHHFYTLALSLSRAPPPVFIKT
jgi:hypothetical protein